MVVVASSYTLIDTFFAIVIHVSLHWWVIVLHYTFTIASGHLCSLFITINNLVTDVIVALLFKDGLLAPQGRMVVLGHPRPRVWPGVVSAPAAVMLVVTSAIGTTGRRITTPVTAMVIPA